MGYYTYTKDPIGAFQEKDVGNWFEFSMNDEQDSYSKAIKLNYPHKVWVGGGQINDSGWRYANVKKTVAYVLVDEDEGGPILERWFLKKHKEYAV
jgi:hypothetical protein